MNNNNASALTEEQKTENSSSGLIQLKGITKWYGVGGGRAYVLNNIDFDVREGEFISVMGPSGSGKSTLLNVIGMLDEPSEGDYFFNGESVLGLKEKQRSQLYKQHIGFVFQAYHLI